MESYEKSVKFAQHLDSSDPLSKYRERFHFPRRPSGEPYIYLSGNSLGLQPKKTREYIDHELQDWADLGVEGHLNARTPWISYHETLTEQLARLVGAKPIEVVAMNSLTVNLHLLMTSFYRPTASRFKILMEKSAFSSDQYAVASQVRLHGFEPKTTVIELAPRHGESSLRDEDILDVIRREGASLALVLFGNVNYLTGQAFDFETITKVGHEVGATVGFDLAHGAGNLLLKLHDWNVDFAAWCSYKYLNAGPGAIAGCFVHERHSRRSELPRLEGWWGHDKRERFKMDPIFKGIPGAEGWQLSNPPIFQLAALRASMEIFDEAGMSAVRKKGDLLTGFLEFLLKDLKGCEVITPRSRGSQLSLRFKSDPRQIQSQLHSEGVISDIREPDILRVSPAPLYCSFSDVYRFAELLAK